jgi:hypothetical protein
MRHKVANWLEQQGEVLGGLIHESPDDGYDHVSHVQAVRTLCTPVGEDAIIAIANVFKRQVAVHISRLEPVVYSPEVCDSIQGGRISLAFYMPGHYKAVVLKRTDDITTAHSLN